tara:strand:- start:888 stop:1097 length:210 start_codon:yes stop_codon:yes gene_type:complete
MPGKVKAEDVPSTVSGTVPDTAFNVMPELQAKWLEAMTAMTSGMLIVVAGRVKEDTKIQVDLLQARGLA